VVSCFLTSQRKPYKHLSHVSHMFRPLQLHWFNHHNNIRWRTQAVKFIIIQFSPRLIYLHLDPNIVLNTLFSETLSLCSSLKVTDQVSHPYNTTGKITVLYSSVFKFFFVWDRKTKIFGLNDSKHSLNFISVLQSFQKIIIIFLPCDPVLATSLENFLSMDMKTI